MNATEPITLYVVRDRSAGGQILDVTTDAEWAEICRDSYGKTYWRAEGGPKVPTDAYLEERRAVILPAE